MCSSITWKSPLRIETNNHMRRLLIFSASLAFAASNFAQSPPPKLPDWDVVSIHPAPADLHSCTQGSGMVSTEDGIKIFCIPVLFVIEQAYLIREPSRILGPPTWMASTMYDITAKVSADDLAAHKKLSDDDRNRMLQPL